MINFSSSYSPFESSFAAGASIAFCSYFMYYRKNKFFTIFSLLFAILTFKRLAVVFAIVLVFLPKLIDVNKNVNKVTKIIMPIFFIVMTLVYFKLLLPQNKKIFYKIFGESQDAFTMGRSGFLREYLHKKIYYPGLGATTAILGKGLEMDLIRIYLETTIVGLFAFTCGYWKCAGNTRYTYIYMTFIFLNLLTSHSLSNSFNWILSLITIACITYKKKENYTLFRKKKEEI